MKDEKVYGQFARLVGIVASDPAWAACKMIELETRIRALEEENERIKSENTYLVSENEQIKEANERLEEELFDIECSARDDHFERDLLC